MAQIINAAADERLMDIISHLHAAYEGFNEWSENGISAQFSDENSRDIQKISLDFGAMECNLISILGSKISFDLEMNYRRQTL